MTWRDALILGAIVAGIGITILIGLFSMGLFGGWSDRLSAKKDQVYGRADTFLVALQEKRYSDSFKSMSPEYRQKISASDYRKIILDNPYLSTLESGQLGEYRGFQGAATLSGVLQAKTGTVQAVIQLVQRDDKWFIEEVVLAGRPSLEK